MTWVIITLYYISMLIWSFPHTLNSYVPRPSVVPDTVLEAVSEVSLDSESVPLKHPCGEPHCGDGCHSHPGDVFVDDTVLVSGTEQLIEDPDCVLTEASGLICGDADPSANSAGNPNAKAVVFSLRNQVGGLVRALRVFKVCPLAALVLRVKLI